MATPLEQLAAFRSASVHHMELTEGRSLALSVLRFDEAMFTSAHFTAARLPCPDSIARSVRKRQAEFFFGRLAARQAMARAGVEQQLVSAGVGIGRSREPLWPAGLVGSISHTTGIAMAAASPSYSGIGIDVERVISHETRAAVLQLTMDGAETRMLERCSGPMSLDERITVVFSAKESLFKAAFSSVKRYFDFSAARLSSLDLQSGRLELTLVEPLNQEFARGRRCELTFASLEGGFIVTACAFRNFPRLGEVAV
ncbi:4'-phosphopantetheinyl transferase superfamily protein [Pelomonas sp. APW6]|uniref:Enterobactin synthase component D n=1 Tax=Roseateles subflavus TaxID=3053353 RepID=A0ABT7LL10_9BURK|nr:4'-phosphopantetheinyl transferase superfamily protein [Pelomonas sp. APW6]MDL5033560.1 4'-phosphopantetheinyl transferase superfamily protein [Pelomonas sp. APW6]